MKREREQLSDDDEEVEVFKQECKAEVSIHIQLGVRFKYSIYNKYLQEVGLNIIINLR